MTFDLRRVELSVVRDLCAKFHAYKGAGNVSVYAFAVFENERAVAAYTWQPPPPGAALSVCPEAPAAVLALSRMVAVPKSDRLLKHISKPLMVQMKRLIDRTRWPVLVTYSDEGQGHTGYVYKCSGWTPTTRRRVAFYETDGVRTSSYSAGKTVRRADTRAGFTVVQRWESWVCPPGTALDWMNRHGWIRRPTGKKWASGKPAYEWIKLTESSA